MQGLKSRAQKYHLPINSYKQSALSAWHKHPYLITGSVLLGAGIIARWMHQKQQHFKALHIHLRSQKQLRDKIIEAVINKYEFREEYTKVDRYDASNRFPCELSTQAHNLIQKTQPFVFYVFKTLQKT